MEITSLKCNHCGANLQINPKIKFFNCTFCGSSLTIKKSGNVMFTEVLDEIKEDTEIIKENSEVLLLEKEIARLDRDWLMEREQYKIQVQNGNTTYPNTDPNHNSDFILGASMIGGLLFFGVIFLNISQSKSQHFNHPVFETHQPEPSFQFLPFIIFGIFALVAVVYSLKDSNDKSLKYRNSQQKYSNKRTELLNQIEQMKNQ